MKALKTSSTAWEFLILETKKKVEDIDLTCTTHTAGGSEQELLILFMFCRNLLMNHLERELPYLIAYHVKID